MFYKWIPILVFLGAFILAAKPAWGEQTVDPDSDNGQTLSSPEKVSIFSINGRTLDRHPPVINVLPGEQVSFEADIVDFGDGCPHPEGCPESKDADIFTWSASDRSDDLCNARFADTCRDRTSFQREGNEMIFHIPYAMGKEITVRVTRENSYADDTIVLRNAHYSELASSGEHEWTSGYYYDDRYDYVYGPEIRDPYWSSYYPCSYYWGPYSYVNTCSYWTVNVGIGIGVGWGWAGWGPWPYWGGWWGYGHPYWGGWSGGYYHPVGFGYYRSGWWRPGYAGAGGPRFWERPEAPRFAGRPESGFARGGGYGNNFEERGNEFEGRGGGFRRRGRW